MLPPIGRRENPDKVYVKVRVDFLFDGTIKPLKFRSESGQPIIIDKILDVREAASLKAGGQGLRYTCLINDQILYLFFEDPYWFVERTDDFILD